MRTHAIVVPAPFLDDDLRFAERRKYLPVEQLIAQPPIEALDVAVLLRPFDKLRRALPGEM